MAVDTNLLQDWAVKQELVHLRFLANIVQNLYVFSVKYCKLSHTFHLLTSIGHGAVFAA